MIRLIYRRQLVLGGLLTVLHGACCSMHAQAQPLNTGSGGCWLVGEDANAALRKATQVNSFESGTEQMEPRSGNSALDKALARSLANISRTFNVLPGFTYYDDSGSPNAQATSRVLLGNTDGTVLFGLAMLREVLRRPSNPDASIVAICAHEFGHILSYKNGMIQQLNPPGDGPFRGEQFADYMAGYFAGSRKLVSPSYPAVAFAVTQRDFGGGDHGSGLQRGQAVERGFIDAFQRRLTIGQAEQEALTFAMSQQL